MPIDLITYTKWMTEISQQPAWRVQADKEMDYRNGNQLSSGVLAAQKSNGLPPAIEPLIGPTIDSVLGMEVKNRRDWRVLAEEGQDDIALALNHELNKSERKSRADEACSAAYDTQVTVGLGWVEVGRSSDPFKFPYRCRAIHRNEIAWDWFAKEADLSDARYMRRRKWMDVNQAALMMPEHADLIKHSGNGWGDFGFHDFSEEGGTSTGLAIAQDRERGWTIEEMEWRDISRSRVCLHELWYQEWSETLIIQTPDGRIVEFRKDDELHVAAVASGAIKPQTVILPKMRLSWWIGPHLLYDVPTPYKHNRFPYIPFWGKREDRTGVPFGLARGMMYLQDEVNARISRMQWGLGAVRTVRTEGAVMMTDEELNAEVARPDADIILNHQKMKDGGVFKIERDFQLNQQQYDRLIDCREGIKRVGGIYASFMGQDSQSKSGVAINSLVEQSNQTLADINDNFMTARAAVGELLLSLIIEDKAGKPWDVKVPASISREERIIKLNAPGEGGDGTLDNDIQMVRARVELSDVPSSPTFRTQQLQTLGSAFESMPPNYQAIALPHLLNLMDIPNKDEILEAVKAANQQPTPEQIQQMIQDEVSKALLKANIDLKSREIAVKERQSEKDAITKGVAAAFAAMQTGEIIMRNPHIAPVGDEVLAVAGSDMTVKTPQGQPQQPGTMSPDQMPIQSAVPEQRTDLNPGPNVGMNRGMMTPQSEPIGTGVPINP